MRFHIQSAVEHRLLAQQYKHGTKCYTLGRVAAWAQDKWPGRYDHLPAIRDPNSGRMIGVHGGRYGLNASASPTPGTLVECQAQLQQAMLRIASLEQDGVAARDDADNLRPDAEKWRKLRERNKENARQPRTLGRR